MTDLGEQEYHVPASTKQRDAAWDAEEWKASDELALMVLLLAGNKLVPISKPRLLGLSIEKSVLQRRLKIDAATRRLVKRKSRLCKDGGEELRKRHVSSREARTHRFAEQIDELAFKMQFAKGAQRGDLRSGLRRDGLRVAVASDRGVDVAHAQRVVARFLERLPARKDRDCG